VKLDLFSALGEARRQLEDLKAKTAQILAVSQVNLLNEAQQI
jgi:hypothetical protein